MGEPTTPTQPETALDRARERVAEKPTTMMRSYRFLLVPSQAQAQKLSQIVGACRFVYNLALEQRQGWWCQYRRNTGRSISAISQGYELTQLRSEVDWLAAIPRDALEQALIDLDGAYQAFFSGRAKYPTYRRRSSGAGFRVPARWSKVEHLSAKWAQVHLPKVGLVRFRLTRPIAGERKTISIREECGRWYISFACKIAAASEAPLDGSLGIDRGVANSLALSTGEMISVPASLLEVGHRRARAQRRLARCKKGSKRRLKQRDRLVALYARARRIRTDWSHRASTDIARRFGHVAVEDLKIANMTKSGRGKHGLNRAILHQGWGQVVRLLDYKLAATGGTLIRVNPAYTSQTCSACGVVDSRSRESQARFKCVECGHEAHADTNAALNILRRSTAPNLGEGARQRPDEARTTEIAA